MVKGEDPWDLRVFCDTRRMDATNVSSHKGPRNRHSEKKLATEEGRWHRWIRSFKAVRLHEFDCIQSTS